jgi:hypothetical protein
MGSTATRPFFRLFTWICANYEKGATFTPKMLIERGFKSELPSLGNLLRTVASYGGIRRSGGKKWELISSVEEIMVPNKTNDTTIREAILTSWNTTRRINFAQIARSLHVTRPRVVQVFENMGAEIKDFPRGSMRDFIIISNEEGRAILAKADVKPLAKKIRVLRDAMCSPAQIQAILEITPAKYTSASNYRSRKTTSKVDGTTKGRVPKYDKIYSLLSQEGAFEGNKATFEQLLELARTAYPTLKEKDPALQRVLADLRKGGLAETDKVWTFYPVVAVDGSGAGAAVA